MRTADGIEHAAIPLRGWSAIGFAEIEKVTTGIQLVDQGHNFRLGLPGPAKSQINEIEIKPARHGGRIGLGWMSRAASLQDRQPVAHDWALEGKSRWQAQLGIGIHTTAKT